MAMEQKIEGLILDKLPWRERDILARLLLRNGRKVSIIFYGGQGGGSKKKTSLLEIGHLLKIELQHSKRLENDVYTAKEFSLEWAHNKIRLNHQAFYLLCFFLEIINKVSPVDNLQDQYRDFGDNFEDLFRVTSNALFYLEKSVQDNNFSSIQHSFLFLCKLLNGLGVFPQINTCHFCHASLAGTASLLSIAEGGFICQKCLQHPIPEEDQSLGKLMQQAIQIKYSEYLSLPPVPHYMVKMVMDYFIYQHHFEQKDFKTLPFIVG